MTSYVCKTVKNNCYGDVTGSYLGQGVLLTLFEHSLIAGLGLGAGVLGDLETYEIIERTNFMGGHSNC